MRLDFCICCGRLEPANPPDPDIKPGHRKYDPLRGWVTVAARRDDGENEGNPHPQSNHTSIGPFCQESCARRWLQWEPAKQARTLFPESAIPGLLALKGRVGRTSLSLTPFHFEVDPQPAKWMPALEAISRSNPVASRIFGDFDFRPTNENTLPGDEEVSR